ncbi:MAG TPA: hypothetical protein VF530_12400, partial [Planctomycetota bacterium]
SASCNAELLSYDSPLGRLWVRHRPGHTPGSVDLVLDVLGNPADRWLIQGSSSGGCPAPSGVQMTLAAHGTAMVGGPRRAAVTQYNGTGTNRTCFTSVTPPRVGSTWVVQLDLASHAGATHTYVFGSDCHYEPGLATPYGEMLVDPLGRYPLNVLRPVFAADKELVGMDIPKIPSLMGRVLYVQGAILGGRVELCNALRIVLGF